MIRRACALLTALLILAPFNPVQAAGSPSPFASWAAVVAAGDFRDHDGNPAEIFDNARRDVSAGLIAAGFSAANLAQFSTRPDLYPDPKPGQTDQTLIGARLRTEAETAKGGCLYYYTSHGIYGAGALWASDQPRVLRADILDLLLDSVCEDRPTVVVISACFSGYYVPYLQAPNRMILTAAREDRTSFGCGATDKYPYFDDCFISTLKTASDFIALGKAVQACVAEKEGTLKAAGQSDLLPSEPQVSIGAEAAKALAAMPFRH